MGLHPSDGKPVWYGKLPGHQKLYGLLSDLVSEHAPAGFVWHSITLNKDLQCRRHTDRGNHGPSLIIGFGDYTGGKLGVWQPWGKDGAPTIVDIKHRLVSFDGKTQPHETQPFTGTRFTAVFYSGGEEGTYNDKERKERKWLHR
mmetsp:Transcript_23158/g.82718  ORF Transcript_23158/g.82718 Transcript_23158/m.82718 type:complete len:144 (-) Transcript_23158:145-576(-)